MRRFSNEPTVKRKEQSMKRREKENAPWRPIRESEELFKRSPMIVEIVHLRVRITENKISQRLEQSRPAATDYNLHVE